MPVTHTPPHRTPAVRNRVTWRRRVLSLLGRLRLPAFLRPTAAWIQDAYQAFGDWLVDVGTRWVMRRIHFDRDRLFRELQLELTGKIQQTRTRIDKAIDDSERDVLATGRCVTSVLEDARSHAAESRKTLAQVDADSPLAKAIATQSSAMEAFLSELIEELAGAEPADIT